MWGRWSVVVFLDFGDGLFCRINQLLQPTDQFSLGKRGHSLEPSFTGSGVQLIQRLKKASKAGSVVDDLEIRLVNLSHLSPHQIGSHSRQNKKGVRFGFSLTPFLARARYGVGSRNSWHP